MLRGRLFILLPFALFAGLALLLYVRLGAGDPAQLPSVLIGKPAPALDLPALEGAGIPGLASADLQGRVTVVNVWSSWCGPCREEHPLLLKLAREHPDVRVVGVNYKDKSENARRFLEVLGNPFAAVGVDARGRTAIDWGVYGVPETFIVDAQGVIVRKHIGPLTEEAIAKIIP